MTRRILFLFFLLAVILSATASPSHPFPHPKGQTTPSFNLQRMPAAARAKVTTDVDFGRFPLSFIPNQGQLDKRVHYYVQGKDKVLYFGSEGVTFSLSRVTEPRGSGRWNVTLEFLNANPRVCPVGEEKSGAVVSYFRGKPQEWRTGLATFSRIIYRNLWPGIDLVYRGTVNRLKYEFVVHPGADPSKIRLAYRGAERLAVDDDGRLCVTTPVVTFQDDTPVAYQEKNGKRMDVGIAYEVGEKVGARPGAAAAQEAGAEPLGYGFAIGDYDPGLPLILDPAVLVYCGFVGGAGEDRGNGIAVDAAGCAYVTGGTYSTEANFPVTAGPDLTYNGGNYDVFVAKLNAAGTALVYCGYIGGSAYDVGSGIAVDASGNAYITGTTESTAATFPVSVGPDLTHNGGYDDAFVAKVNAAGTSLVYCGYIGGSAYDAGNGIAVDGSGNAHIIGTTASTAASFPETVGPDLTYNGGIYDAFVAEVNASGAGLVYCGYIGGAGDDYGWGIAVDGTGAAYVLGDTDSTESTFPVAGGPDPTQNGDVDVFVGKVNPAGSALVYCGYIGGAWTDHGCGIAVDKSGSAYIVGYTDSMEATFPVRLGPDITHNGGFDAFVAKVDPAGAALVYCGYIGGSSYDLGSGIAVDGVGNAHVTGWTRSNEATFPVMVGPDLSYNDTANYFDAFAAKINASGTGLVYCGYIGGDSYDYGNGIAVDAAGSAYVTGYTWSKETTFPVTAGPDLTQNGNFDALAAKILYVDDRLPKHAVGDFDDDGRVEVAMDFGAKGIWLYNSGAWTQLSPVNPESLLAADVDGDGVDEIVADLGASGLWLWSAGVWLEISAVNVETMSAGDIDADGADEIAGDFGAVGLWLLDAVGWVQLSGANADRVSIADVDGTGGADIVGDFGGIGLWLRSAGAWTQLSGANVEWTTAGRAGGARFLVGDFGPIGLWSWTAGSGWTQLSGANADYVLAADTDGDATDEIVGDFGSLGLWLCDSGAWTELSGANAESMISGDFDADGSAELAAGFGTIGLWLWNGGAWTQLSGVSPDSLLAGDFYGDIREEIIADFGILGVWLWYDGAWTQISSSNPD